MEEEKSRLDRIEEKLDMIAEGKKKPKDKKFKLPFRGKVGKGKVKKNWATYLIINENREVDFKKFQIDEQTVVIDGIPKIATPEEMLTYKGKPFVIQPSWSVKPWSLTDSYDQAMRDNYMAQGYRLLLNRMFSEALKLKKKISGLVIFIVIVAIVIVGYLVTKGGFFK